MEFTLAAGLVGIGAATNDPLEVSSNEPSACTPANCAVIVVVPDSPITFISPSSLTVATELSEEEKS